MAIVDTQLIVAPVLQDLVVSKLGVPLAAGIIYFYEPDGVTSKNWYYQSGTGTGPFTYLAGPNPLTLSAAGTFVDVNGNDVIPYFYPYSELDNVTPQGYTIEVFDSLLNAQFTRYNFPLSGSEISPTTTQIPTFENYILNNRLWRNNGGSITLTANAIINNTYTYQYNSTGTYYYQPLIPSQHDGFSMPDMIYIKNNYTSGDVISFNKFASGTTSILTNDITPEYYINHTTTIAGTGESLKAYQFPVSLHINTLDLVTATFTIQAQWVSGSQSLNIYLYQFLGSGVTSVSASNPLLFETITLTNTWEKYIVPFTFPSSSGLTLSATGDDAFYIQIGMPLNAVSNINFALPSLYLSSLVPTNSFQTYDQIDTIINSPRTGDVRASINSFYPYGWVQMNNGTIGNASSNATARANVDTWPLYNLLWNAFQAYSTGTSSSGTNPLAQMYTSTGTAIGYGTVLGTTAYGDFNANKALALTNMMGQVIMGTVPLTALLAATPTIKGYSSLVTASSSTGLLFTTDASNLLNLFTGNTVTFTGSTTLVNVTANKIYYIIPISSTTFKVATSFANALAGTYVAYIGVETGAVTAYLQLNGSSEGEYAHTQLTTELASHNHTATTTSPSGTNVTGATNTMALAQSNSNTFTGVAVSIQNQGNSTPFNVTQPSVMMNIYMKL